MKMAKLRRRFAAETAVLRAELADKVERLEQARVAWPALAKERDQLATQLAKAEIASIQDRRADLVRLTFPHQQVIRRATGRRHADRLYCECCNTLWPCRTIELTGKINAELDALYAEKRAN
jgi:hypothetical protein